MAQEPIMGLSAARTAIVHHPDFVRYDFGDYHPLRPERIDAGLDLIETAGLWDKEVEGLTPPTAASAADLETVHSPEYIWAVGEAGLGCLPDRRLAPFGMGSTDNPPFPDMHYSASLITGGTLMAVHEVMSRRLDHAFNPTGGFHHALRARASGFCVYNDPAIACAVALRDYGARVLYVDLDCHHGDGVQWIFYDEPRVCTVSFHETGRFLFPGTGDIGERGTGEGEGYAVNVPFLPFTQDSSWHVALERLLPAIAGWFEPDLIVSNHGCDTHRWDPLTHLALTTKSFAEQVSLIHKLAHVHCKGRWIAVGSGGYDWRRVVPRSWAIVWAEMSGRKLPVNLPEAWRARWLDQTDSDSPQAFLDSIDTPAPTDQTAEIERENQETIDAVSRLVGEPASSGRG